MGDLRSFNQGLDPSSFSELTQAIACLVDDLEGAKQLSATQIAALTVDYDSAISERDDALRSLSLLSDQQEIDLQEKEELRFQCSGLQNEIDALKREVSIKSAELEQLKSEISSVEHEASSILRQVHQLQAELEHYFLLCRDQAKLLKASAQLQSRSTALLLKATI